MIKFNLNDKEYALTTEWEELTLGQWIKLQKLTEIKETFLIEIQFIVKAFDILCNVEDGELDDLSITQLNEMGNQIKILGNPSIQKTSEHLIIDGEDYVCNFNLDKITSGEYISIQLIQQGNTNSLEVLPQILSILIRPGKLINGEWKMDKFDANDIENRSIKLLNAKAIELLGCYDFFLSGIKNSEKIIPISLMDQQKEVPMMSEHQN